MATQATIKTVLVSMGRNKMKVKFSGSREGLIDAIASTFQLAKESVTRLQIWKENRYEDLEENDEIPDKCKLSIETEVVPNWRSRLPWNRDQPKQLLCVAAPGIPNSGSTESVSTPAEAARACISTGKTWKGRKELLVFFLNASDLKEWNWKVGSDQMTIPTIIAWASGAWRANGVPEFKKTPIKEEADIRVQFIDGGGCWSMVGMDAQTITDMAKPTMCLDLNKHGEDDQKSLVVHEFGHALGLEHEHQRSDFWDVLEKYIDMEKMREHHQQSRPESESERDGRAAGFNTQWFRKLTKKTEINQTESEYDPDSIMHYKFEIHWLKNKQHRNPLGIDRDPDLSDRDKKFLKGYHKRSKSFAKKPSTKDIECLKMAYGDTDVTDPERNNKPNSKEESVSKRPKEQDGDDYNDGPGEEVPKTKEVLVTQFGGSKPRRRVSFQIGPCGSELQNLTESIEMKFADDLKGKKIQRLNIYASEFKMYVALEEENEIPHQSKIKVELQDVPYCRGAPEISDRYRRARASDAPSRIGQPWVEKKELYVTFLNPGDLEKWNCRCGSDTMTITTIMAWASAWRADTVPELVKIKDVEKADIRVKFTKTGGCWSMLGTDARYITDKKQPTMCLNLQSSGEDDQRSLVIHEFGHALGLNHEHQRSDFWDVVEKHIDRDKMRADPNVQSSESFPRYSWFKNDTVESDQYEYDPESIMHLQFNVQWLKDKRYHDSETVDGDSNLDDRDKKVLKGIHERNKGPATVPSKTDIECLNKAYDVKNVHSTDPPQQTQSAVDRPSADPPKSTQHYRLKSGQSASASAIDLPPQPSQGLKSGQTTSTSAVDLPSQDVKGRRSTYSPQSTPSKGGFTKRFNKTYAGGTGVKGKHRAQPQQRTGVKGRPTVKGKPHAQPQHRVKGRHGAYSPKSKQSRKGAAPPLPTRHSECCLLL